jgi:hypothetical protein
MERIHTYKRRDIGSCEDIFPISYVFQDQHDNVRLFVYSRQKLKRMRHVYSVHQP